MVAQVKTVAFQGIDILEVDAHVTIASGFVAFNVVGLPDKAVAGVLPAAMAAPERALGLSLINRFKGIHVFLPPELRVRSNSSSAIPLSA